MTPPIDSASARESECGSRASARAHLCWLRAAARGAAYPLLLGAVVVTACLGIRMQLDPPLLSLLFMWGVMAYLALLERWIPFDESWHPTPLEWARDGIYYLVTMLGGGLAQLAVLQIAQLAAPAAGALPLWLEIPLATLLSSFVTYLFHRASHRDGWLWRIHGIHHLPTKVNLANNSVNHVLDVFGRRFAAQLPLFLLGISQPALFACGLFTIAQGYFLHANIDVRLGRWNYLLMGPEQHRLHHAVQLSEAGHFGNDIALWDLLFGSFRWSEGKRPLRIGVVHPEAFPPTDSIAASLAHPFRSALREPRA